MIKARINKLIAGKKSLLCVGLDSDPEKIPSIFHGMERPVLAFNRAVIEATEDVAIAYKPNLAFYECRGIAGLQDLADTLKVIPKEIITVGDAKRGDIGTTSQMYAKAFFDHWQFDTLTVAPYMGYDSIEPFLQYPDKLTFVLCLTSNSGSKDFEEQPLKEGKLLYEKVLEKVLLWNQHDNLGIVVGATKPEQLAEIRQAAPNLVFLIPGIGAQGGSLEEAIRYGTDSAGGSALINTSRAIIYPQGNFSSIAEFQKAVAAKAEDFVAEMRRYL
ncbi:MAG: orotidine-5'-phosphate decarboxylase [Chlorobiales bacterium]|jgi:orotidine-5'-phosphate decarboxylase|nr:orotidine-5'-phosphate decarboxylase [Chlorobiales bacterium]